MSSLIPQHRLETMRRRRQEKAEQAIIEACEAALDENPRDMGDLIDKAKSRIDAQRQQESER